MEKKKIHVLPNTHWDREWYMPLEKYRIRLVRMMDRLLDLMERDGDYIFLTDGQYMIIEDYLAVRPENRDRIAALTEAGRLLPGPWYTQPLETLVTGEAMVRNLILGVRESRALGGVMRFGYMVDEFGHASQTPQILRGFGIGNMMVWRGMDPALPKVFTWCAPDGTSVTMHRSIAGYGEATALPASMEDYTLDYEGMQIRRPGLRSAMKNLQSIKEREPLSDVQFWLNGIDHSWAQEDLSDRLAQIRENWPAYDARISTPDAYAADMAALMAGEEPVSFTGELMYPDNLLVSTHSCRADHKLMHYRAEHLIENYAEPASALAWVLGGEDARWIADRAWKYILENHAHDSLGCCSVDEVYLQCMARYGSSISLSEQLLEDSLAHMTAVDGDGEAVYIYYPNSSRAGGSAEVVLDIPEGKDPGAFVLEDGEGRTLPMALIRREKVMSTRYNPRRGHPTRVPCSRYTLAVALPENEGIALRKLHMVPVKAFGSTRRAPEHGVLENAFLRAEIAGNGTVSLLDKKTGVRYDDLLLLEDGGENGTFYVHTKPEEDRLITNRGASARITCLADNAVMTRYRVEYTLMIPAGITSDARARLDEDRPMDVTAEITLFRDRDRLDVRMTVDNRSDDHRLRVLFPTGIVGGMSRSGQPFDTVERPAGRVGQDAQGLAEAASGVYDAYTATASELECHPMQDFCGGFAPDRGLAVAAPGVYEYEMTDTGDLALTLFRAVDCIDRFEEHRQTGFDTRQAQLHTALTYDLAIFPHGEDLPAAEIADFVRPPRVWYFREREDALREDIPAPAQRSLTDGPLAAVEGEGVVITMIKRTEEGEGLVVRLLNTGKEARTAVLRLSGALGAFGTVTRTNLEENPLEKVGSGNACTAEIPGKGLVTLRFDR